MLARSGRSNCREDACTGTIEPPASVATSVKLAVALIVVASSVTVALGGWKARLWTWLNEPPSPPSLKLGDVVSSPVSAPVPPSPTPLNADLPLLPHAAKTAASKRTSVSDHVRRVATERPVLPAMRDLPGGVETKGPFPTSKAYQTFRPPAVAASLQRRRRDTM